MQKNKGPLYITLGILLLVIAQARITRLGSGSASSFKTEPVIINENFKGKPGADTPERIIIPSLQLDLEISPSRLIDGYWEVFKDRAGYGLGSGSLGIGNAVVFAHAKPGLFASLRNIKTESRIYILSGNKNFTFSVTSIKEVSPNNKEIISDSQTPLLTLYTCSGFFDSKRLIVTAKLI